MTTNINQNEKVVMTNEQLTYVVIVLSDKLDKLAIAITDGFEKLFERLKQMK